MGVLALVAGFSLGLLTSYLRSSRRLENRDLERQLADASATLRQYRQEVSDHYVKTAGLVDALTDSYRELHNHLAEGAASLLDTRGVQPLMHNIPSRDKIEALADPGSYRIQPPLDYAPKASPSDKGVLDERFGLDKPADDNNALPNPLDEAFLQGDPLPIGENQQR